MSITDDGEVLLCRVQHPQKGSMITDFVYVLLAQHLAAHSHTLTYSLSLLSSLPPPVSLPTPSSYHAYLICTILFCWGGFGLRT